MIRGTEIVAATLTWDLRGHPEVGGQLAMTPNLGLFEATLPLQPEGEVLRYGVDVELSSGQHLLFPDNPADPQYESFVGVVTPIYCTDFEVDPADEGWTHEMIAGGGRRPRDEWQWGTPGLGRKFQLPYDYPITAGHGKT